MRQAGFEAPHNERNKRLKRSKLVRNRPRNYWSVGRSRITGRNVHRKLLERWVYLPKNLRRVLRNRSVGEFICRAVSRTNRYECRAIVAQQGALQGGQRFYLLRKLPVS